MISRWLARADGSKPEAIGGENAAREKTMRLAIVEGTGWAAMTGCGENFFSAFAIFLKASNLAVAVVTSAPLLLGALAQMLGAWWIDRYRQRRQLLQRVLTLQALAYAFVVLMPFFFSAHAVPLAILCALLTMFLGNITIPVWISLIGDVVPDARRGDYFGHRWRILFLCLAAANLGGGLLLARYEQVGWVWAGFGALFGLAGFARLITAQLFPYHYEAEYKPATGANFNFWDFLRRAPRSNFAHFAFYAALMNAGANISAPFFAVYMLRDLHWTYTEFTLNAITMLITQVVFFRWWGRVGDRHGNRSVLIATSCVLPILPILWACTGNFWLLLGAQIVSGATWSGYNLAIQNFILDAVTPTKRAKVYSYYSLINGVFIFIAGTVIGAWLANHLPSAYHLGPLHVTFVSSLPAVFIVSGVARIFVLLLMASTFREVREHVPIYPGTLILRQWSGEAVTGTLQEVATRINALRRK
ncbi:MAG: MFS transporter [Kiritimatiellaeota bacterium]|nr:MFS transporter [Kiritimatiellota bacterium]